MRLLTALVLLAVGLTLGSCSKPAPVAEQKACSPPRDYWRKPHNFDGLMPPRMDVSLDHTGKIYWNGQPVSGEKLSHDLRIAHGMNPEPEFFLETEMGVSCVALDTLRNRMDQALECKKPYSNCAEGVLSIWRNVPSQPGTPPS